MNNFPPDNSTGFEPHNGPDKPSEAQTSAKQGVPSPADLVSDVLKEARDVLSAADQLGSGLIEPFESQSEEDQTGKEEDSSVPAEDLPKAPQRAQPQTIGEEQAEIRAAEQDARDALEAELRAEAAAPLRSVASSVDAISPGPLGIDDSVLESELDEHARKMELLSNDFGDETPPADRFAELDDLHGDAEEEVKRREDETAVPEWRPESNSQTSREWGEPVDVLEEFAVIADHGTQERTVRRRMMDVAAVTLACWVPVAWAFAVFMPKESPANGPSLSELIESAPVPITPNGNEGVIDAEEVSNPS